MSLCLGDVPFAVGTTTTPQDGGNMATQAFSFVLQAFSFVLQSFWGPFGVILESIWGQSGSGRFVPIVGPASAWSGGQLGFESVMS